MAYVPKDHPAKPCLSLLGSRVGRGGPMAPTLCLPRYLALGLSTYLGRLAQHPRLCSPASMAITYLIHLTSPNIGKLLAYRVRC